LSIDSITSFLGSKTQSENPVTPALLIETLNFKKNPVLNQTQYLTPAAINP